MRHEPQLVPVINDNEDKLKLLEDVFHRLGYLTHTDATSPDLLKFLNALEARDMRIGG